MVEALQGLIKQGNKTAIATALDPTVTNALTPIELEDFEITALDQASDCESETNDD